MENNKLKRHGTNCISIGNKLYSYETHVADISEGSMIELGWWSMTTSKHVKRAANDLGLNYVKYKRQ